MYFLGKRIALIICLNSIHLILLWERENVLFSGKTNCYKWSFSFLFIYVQVLTIYILSNIEQSYDNIIQHRVNYNCNDEFCLMRIYQDVF